MLSGKGAVRSQKEQLVFSSEDSLNSNNSFASSVDEEDDKEDFANHFLHLKDQMETFLQANPQLNDALKFDPFKEPSDNEDTNAVAAAATSQHDPHGMLAMKAKSIVFRGPKIEHRNLQEADKLRKLNRFGKNASSSSNSVSSDDDTQRGSGDQRRGTKLVKFAEDSSTKPNKTPKNRVIASAGAAKSKLWGSLTKDVVRMGQFGCKTPTLETVNHRLNIFKSKIEKIDYFEMLQKEMTATAGGIILNTTDKTANLTGATAVPTTATGISQSTILANTKLDGASSTNDNTNPNQQTANNSSTAAAAAAASNNRTVSNNNYTEGGASNDLDEDDNTGRDSEGNLIYFSFRKRMQNALQDNIERTKSAKQKEQQIRVGEAKFATGKGGRRANMFARGALDAKKLVKERELQEKKRRAANPDLKEKQSSRKSTYLRHGSDDDEQGQDNTANAQSNQLDKDSGLSFQTRVGIALYQTYQQCGGDKESFKKTANFILKDYNKTKQAFFKKKVFPPSQTKFTNDETKALNVFLPDFASNLYAPNKANLFANVDTFDLPPGTPEADFIQVVDKILDGAVLKFWKDAQNHQN